MQSSIQIETKPIVDNKFLKDVVPIGNVYSPQWSVTVVSPDFQEVTIK